MERLLRSDEELFHALVDNFGETDIGIDTDYWIDLDEAIESLVFTTLEAARISAIMERQTGLVACSNHQLIVMLRENFGEEDVSIEPDYWGDDEDAANSMVAAILFSAKEKARILVRS